jgi:hypothetical protein
MQKLSALTSVRASGGVARSLFIALRDRSIELPDDEELRAEALTVRWSKPTPGSSE